MDDPISAPLDPVADPAGTQPFEETEITDQGQVVRRWQGDKLHGNTESFYGNGRLAERQPFVNGQLHGVAETFDDQGQLQQRAHFEAGALHGEVTAYDERGAMQQQSTFRLGVLHGEMKLYAPLEAEQDGASSPQTTQPDHPPAVRLLSQMTYRDGQLDGNLRTFDEAQRRNFEVPFVQGLRHGQASWFQAEALVRQATYINDLLHGDMVDFHPNGKVRERVPYVDDLPHGIAVRYYKSGKVKEKLRYHLGEKVGDSVEYTPRGGRLDKPRKGGR